MNYSINPFIRYIAKTSYYITDKTVATRDCRMLYVLSGSGVINSGGAEYQLRERTLVYFPYATPYKIHSDAGMLFYVINFDFNMENTDIVCQSPIEISSFNSKNIIESLDSADDSAFLNFICIHDAAWAEYDIRNIYNENSEKREGFVYVQSSSMRNILINLSRNISNNLKGGNELCGLMKKYIDENVTYNTKELAELLNYHPYYLGDVFKKNEGITLYQYIIKKRLSKGYELVLTSDYSIEEIACRCGFSSQAHFSAALKKEYGISPGKLRCQI